ncbi:hypothetical protein Stube_22260 [Streptomyces tubercidicus]|uniref:Uncharacterized protein n=1 Tax=Streptomyces tubercidicus TaxID=47759 RepID=A0A640UNE2_9ACTN|nr:hypothetical protein Stube_22260 [Streptomyces tubercidicus]
MPIRGPGTPGGRREWGSDVPTAIAVTSPDLALPSTDRQTPAAVVLQAPQLQPLDDALTETSAVLEHHGHLIALYSSACPPEHIRRLHTLRAVLESDRIAIVPLSLPPLGVALLARQLRQLSLCEISPGVLASAARLLTHYIHAGALLGSVSGLDRVEVDLRAHMKSWLPGAHFAVLAHPEPQLLHLDRHSTEAGLPGPGFATQLAVARGQLTSEWVTGALAPAWQTQGVYEARLPAESARWWGTPKLIEFAAAIPDVSVLYQLVTSVRREQCGWCGLELLGDRCAFCAAPLARERATGGGGSGQGPTAIGGPVSGPTAGSVSAPVSGPQSGPGSPVRGGAHAQDSPSGRGPNGHGSNGHGSNGRGPNGRGGPGQLDVRGPDLTAGGPAVPGIPHGSGSPVPGIPHGSGRPVPGNPYGSGQPVPGNPYASDTPCAPGQWDLPGHPDFAPHPAHAAHPAYPGHPDLAGHPDTPGTPGTPRTVAHVR